MRLFPLTRSPKFPTIRYVSFMTQLQQGLIFYFEWGEFTVSTKVFLDIFISIEACHQNNVRKSPQLSAFWNSSIILSTPLQRDNFNRSWNKCVPYNNFNDNKLRACISSFWSPPMTAFILLDMLICVISLYPLFLGLACRITNIKHPSKYQICGLLAAETFAWLVFLMHKVSLET